MAHPPSGSRSPIPSRLVASLAVATITLGVFTSACGRSLDGSISCSRYRSLSSGDRTTAVKNMMKQHSDGAGTPAKVSATKFSVSLYCELHDGSSQISGIYRG